MKFKDRTGETIINQQGLQMTIYSYVNANQLKVVFEDGYISDWVPYHRFKAGKLKNPYYKDEKLLIKEEIAKTIIGETKKNGLGQEVTVVAFHGFDDIDVEVDDGTLRSGVRYYKFKQGAVKKFEQSDPSPEQQQIENNLLCNAKSFLDSARVLAKGEESALLASVVLCKEAVRNFLKAVVGCNEEDIQFLGRKAKKMIGVEVDPRDLAWLNDFDFEQEKSWLVPTMEDANMAIKVVEEIQEKCCSNGGN